MVQPFQNIFEALLNLAIPLTIFIILLVIPFKSKKPVEWVVAFVLLLLMMFYYVRPVTITCSRFALYGGVVEKIATFIHIYLLIIVKWILKQLPQSLQNNFIESQESKIPVIILFLGIILRWGIGRYVKHERLQQIARAYWLFITTYAIFTIILSRLTGWNYLIIFIVSIACIFAITAGLFRVVGDILGGILNFLAIIWRSIKLGLMSLVYVGTKFVKKLRHFVEFIRELYDRFIIEPFRKLFRYVNDFLDKIENK